MQNCFVKLKRLPIQKNCSVKLRKLTKNQIRDYCKAIFVEIDNNLYSTDAERVINKFENKNPITSIQNGIH